MGSLDEPDQPEEGKPLDDGEETDAPSSSIPNLSPESNPYSFPSKILFESEDDGEKAIILSRAAMGPVDEADQTNEVAIMMTVSGNGEESDEPLSSIPNISPKNDSYSLTQHFLAENEDDDEIANRLGRAAMGQEPERIDKARVKTYVEADTAATELIESEIIDGVEIICNPSDMDIVYDDRDHPGTIVMIDVLCAILKENSTTKDGEIDDKANNNNNNNLDHFEYSPKVYKLIKKRLRGRKFLVQGKQFTSSWREATKSENIHLLGNYFDELKKLKKRRQKQQLIGHEDKARNIDIDGNSNVDSVGGDEVNSTISTVVKNENGNNYGDSTIDDADADVDAGTPGNENNNDNDKDNAVNIVSVINADDVEAMKDEIKTKRKENGKEGKQEYGRTSNNEDNAENVDVTDDSSSDSNSDSSGGSSSSSSSGSSTDSGSNSENDSDSDSESDGDNDSDIYIDSDSDIYIDSDSDSDSDVNSATSSAIETDSYNDDANTDADTRAKENETENDEERRDEDKDEKNNNNEKKSWRQSFKWKRRQKM